MQNWIEVDMSVKKLPKWNYDSYYGAFDEHNKPRQGLADFMIQEHITLLMQKEKDKVMRELNRAIELFKNSMEVQLKIKLKDVDKLDMSMQDLHLFVKNLVKENNLKDPRVKHKSLNM